ncbi:MAG: helix-turn-helix domain-containing protein [Chloroherpetonaceae bacterium]|nr:helix-turn-helix domain-containing protein [Chloroherpetonaceae bacterium]
MIEIIRKNFRPFQPAIISTSSHVQYKEFAPSFKLQPFIYCYWDLKTNERLIENYNYRVIADGCIDIFFEHTEPEKIYVMGFSTAFSEFPLGLSFHYTGIRFLPTAFPQLFQINASEISNQVFSLSDLNKAIVKSLEQIHSCGQDFVEKREEMNRLFEKLLSNTQLAFDPRLYRAIDLILKKRGHVHTESDLNTGLSPRQLRRLFEFYLGDSQKSFSRVVRFQSAVASVFSNKMQVVPDYISLGYFDQTHFIKDFKHAFGLSPGKAVRLSK